MCTSEWWRCASESERKHFAGSESIRGMRVKYSTPVPELEDTHETYINYKEKRRQKALPKSLNSGDIIMPRINSALATKYSNLKKIANKIKP